MNHDIISQILDACKLAREIEASLHRGFVNQDPSILRSLCEDVVRAFNNAIHGLDRQQRGLRAMDLFGLRTMEEAGDPFYTHIAASAEASGFRFASSSTSVSASPQDADPVMSFLGATALAAAAVEGPSSGLMPGRPSAGSTGQRQSRKRKESAGMRTIRVPAVRAGNMENPPDDGYTWRKYGQKDILGSRFPRSYFRCTHKSFYGCLAKKQVQRLDEDPYTYEITYCNKHTCQTSTTPLILPHLVTNNPQNEVTMAVAPPLSTSIQLGSSWFDVSQTLGFHSHGGESSRAANLAGSSDWPFADLADAMFNSGSSGSSMDAIFSLKEENMKDKEE